MLVKAKAEAKKDFLAFLGRKKARLTRQRRAILDTVFNTTEHFTAEQLLGWARERYHDVSRATVYRTLPLLVKSGVVHELNLGREETVYDPNYVEHPAHSHIVCTDCNLLIEFENDRLAEIEAQVRKQLGFTVESIRVQVTAGCDEFRRLGFCPRKERCHEWQSRDKQNQKHNHPT
jgi:Fur family transcriptional regulator, ferric uptake regulator